MSKTDKRDEKKTSKQSKKKVDTRVQELESQVDSLTADVKRAHADFINFKRRAESEKQSNRMYGQREIIKELLPVFDTLERALSHMPNELGENEWAQGIQKAAKQLDSQLESIKVTKINQTDVDFDPQQHDAVSVDDSEGDTEIVAEVLQTGYMFEDTVIRPAMVKVGRK